MFYNIAKWLVVLSTLMPLSLANECEERIERECEPIEDHQCYFDRERTCFKHFSTNCEMKLEACKYKQVFEPWPERYCESMQFMCAEEFDLIHWPRVDLYESIAHIRDNNTNPYEGMF